MPMKYMPHGVICVGISKIAQYFCSKSDVKCQVSTGMIAEMTQIWDGRLLKVLQKTPDEREKGVGLLLKQVLLLDHLEDFT